MTHAETTYYIASDRYDDQKSDGLLGLTETFAAHKETAGRAQVRTYLNKIGAISLYRVEQEVEAAKDIEAGLYAQSLLTDIADETHDEVIREDLELIKDNGMSARNKLVEANLRLVVSIVRRFKNSKEYEFISFWDLVQEGNLALIDAAEKYDYAMGVKFATYATWRINDAIRGYAPFGRALTMSDKTHEKIKKVQAAAAKLFNTLGRNASVEELAKELKMRESTVRTLMITGRESVSLNRKLDGIDGSQELGNLIEDEETIWLGEALARQQRSEKIKKILAELSLEQQSIVQYRYGFNDENVVKSREEVSGLLNISLKQLERRQKTIMDWLRTHEDVVELEELIHT